MLASSALFPAELMTVLVIATKSPCANQAVLRALMRIFQLDPERQMRIALVAALIAMSGPALAFGGGGGGGNGGGDGLNPYAELSGNGRTGGVNSGPYNPPAYNTYLRAYGPNGPGSRRVRDHYRSAPRPYYGYPY